MNASVPAYRKLQRVLLAACILLAPLALAGWFSLCIPYGDPACPDFPGYQGILGAFRAAKPFLLNAFLFINMIVPYLYPLSYIGLGLVAMKRSPWFATIGIVCGYIGSMVWGVVADQSFLLASAARLNQDPNSLLVLQEYGKNWEPFVMGGGWVIGHLFGYVFLGIAFLRSRLVPRWTGWLLIISAPIMGPFAYGLRIGFLQVLGYLLVFLASIPGALAMLKGDRAAGDAGE